MNVYEIKLTVSIQAAMSMPIQALMQLLLLLFRIILVMLLLVIQNYKIRTKWIPINKYYKSIASEKLNF